MRSEIEIVCVTVEFSVTFRILENGWVVANSKYGSTTSYSKEDCIRILSDRARGIA